MLDTGAFSSAMSLPNFEKIKVQCPHLVESQSESIRKTVKMADGTSAYIALKCCLIISIGGQTFQENFLVLPQLNSTLLGMPFFKNHEIVFHPSKGLLYLPDYTFTIPQKNSKTITKKYVLENVSRVSIAANQQEILDCKLQKENRHLENAIGIIEPSTKFEQKTGLCFMSTISKVDNNLNTKVGVINLLPHKVTIPQSTRIGKFTILTPKQASFIIPIHPSLLNTTESTHSILENKSTNNKSNYCPYYNDGFWFATPENCPNATTLSGVQRKIYDTKVNFKKLELLDPTKDTKSRNEFLNKFYWKNTDFTKIERKKMENLLVKHHKIFARHRLDLGKNKDRLVKLTPEHERPIYTPNPTTAIHLRDELLIELALMQYYDIITTLPFSKYSSTIFAQRKSSGKLRILIDLRRINHLLRHDYKNNNFPIPTMADATAHLAGKKIFAKMDCSQAYFSMQMADELSIQLLAFNFGGRTFAFKRLAQGLSRSPTAFSSCVSKHLQSCVANDQCFVYFDDLGSGAIDGESLIQNLDHIFACNEKLGFKLSMDKCEFGIRKINFLGHTITEHGIAPNKKKLNSF